MKTSLEACKGQGSRAVLPSPVSSDAAAHCKPEQRRQSGLSRGSQEYRGGTAPHPTGRSPLHPAPARSTGQPFPVPPAWQTWWVTRSWQ